MRVLAVMVLVLGIMGCAMSASSPTVIELENERGERVGYAFATGIAEFTTADHIFAIHRPLYVSGDPIAVYERNRFYDYLRFSLVDTPDFEIEVGKKRTQTLKVGQRLRWKTGQGTVESLNQTIRIRERDYEGIAVLSGAVVPGDSGLPVYDEKNQVVGMIIGGGEERGYVSGRGF